jgi:hypothetical protein
MGRMVLILRFLLLGCVSLLILFSHLPRPTSALIYTLIHPPTISRVRWIVVLLVLCSSLSGRSLHRHSSSRDASLMMLQQMPTNCLVNRYLIEGRIGDTVKSVECDRRNLILQHVLLERTIVVGSLIFSRESPIISVPWTVSSLQWTCPVSRRPSRLTIQPMRDDINTSHQCLGKSTLQLS